jgi:hypothetical protein
MAMLGSKPDIIGQKRPSTTDANKNQVDSLVEKLEMKVNALNAFKSNGYQQCDSKVILCDQTDRSKT